MPSLDLNKLRQTLEQNRRRGETRPEEPKRKIVVGPDAKIRRGDEVEAGREGEMSTVPQELFAAGFFEAIARFFADESARTPAAPATPSVTPPANPRPVPAGRLARDREIARRKLPPQTREVEVDGTTAFVFPVPEDEFFESYVMAAWFDGDEYQVKVVEPAIEEEYGVVNAHVFGDGRLCLRPPAGGMPTLEEAYAKAVLWASGFSCLRHTGTFPWPSH